MINSNQFLFLLKVEDNFPSREFIMLNLQIYIETYTVMPRPALKSPDQLFAIQL